MLTGVLVMAVVVCYLALWTLTAHRQHNPRVSVPAVALTNYVIGGLCAISLVLLGIYDLFTDTMLFGNEESSQQRRQNAVMVLSVAAAATIAVAAAVHEYERRWRNRHRAMWLERLIRLRVPLARLDRLLHELDVSGTYESKGARVITKGSVLSPKDIGSGWFDGAGLTRRLRLQQQRATWVEQAWEVGQNRIKREQEQVERAAADLGLEVDDYVRDARMLKGTRLIPPAVEGWSRARIEMAGMDGWDKDGVDAVRAAGLRVDLMAKLDRLINSKDPLTVAGTNRLRTKYLSPPPEHDALTPQPTPQPQKSRTARRALLATAVRESIAVFTAAGLAAVREAMAVFTAEGPVAGGMLLISHLLFALGGFAAFGLLNFATYDPSALVLGFTTAGAATLATYGVLAAVSLESAEEHRNAAIAIADRLLVDLTAINRGSERARSSLTTYLGAAPVLRERLDRWAEAAVDQLGTQEQEGANPDWWWFGERRDPDADQMLRATDRVTLAHTLAGVAYLHDKVAEEACNCNGADFTTRAAGGHIDNWHACSPYCVYKKKAMGDETASPWFPRLPTAWMIRRLVESGLVESGLVEGRAGDDTGESSSSRRWSVAGHVLTEIKANDERVMGLSAYAAELDIPHIEALACDLLFLGHVAESWHEQPRWAWHVDSADDLSVEDEIGASMARSRAFGPNSQEGMDGLVLLLVAAASPNVRPILDMAESPRDVTESPPAGRPLWATDLRLIAAALFKVDAVRADVISDLVLLTDLAALPLVATRRAHSVADVFQSVQRRLLRFAKVPLVTGVT